MGMTETIYAREGNPMPPKKKHDRPGRPRKVDSRPGMLAVECWCRTYVVDVPEEDVRYGRTEACEAPYCQRLDAAARSAAS